MTEFEIINTFATAGGELRDSAMNFVTVFFAYVVAAHFVGRSLSRVVATFSSIVYSLFLLGPTSSILGAILQMDVAATDYRASYPAGAYPLAGSDPTWLVSIAMVPLTVGWVGSLMYMHRYIRRKHN